MMGMITSIWVSPLVRVVADLNLADGGLSAAELAEREGSELDSTFRLLRAGRPSRAPDPGHRPGARRTSACTARWGRCGW